MTKSKIHPQARKLQLLPCFMKAVECQGLNGRKCVGVGWNRVGCGSMIEFFNQLVLNDP